ncbi:kinase-like domain-containing protein, partial [Zopfochytrium polystomum]
LGATVGCGSSGSVRKAKHTPTGKMCVVKCVRREREVANRPLLRNADGICHKELFMLREALVGVLLDHPNIIQMHSFFIGRRHFYFFYEYIPGLKTHGRLDENTGRFVFRQLLDAVDYMHRSNVIHRDLKLENMRYDPVSSRLILLDFGFSTFYSPNFSQRSTCGSPCYASPEIYSSAPYKGPEVDIWAMGVCLYGILVGELPFDHDKLQTAEDLGHEGAVRYPDFLSEDARDLIGHMLKLDPIQRATARDIRFSHWLSSPASARTSSLYRPRNFPSTDMVTPEWIDTVLGLERLKRAEAILAELRRRAPQRRAQLEAQWGGTVVVEASPVRVNRLALRRDAYLPRTENGRTCRGSNGAFRIERASVCFNCRRLGGRTSGGSGGGTSPGRTFASSQPRRSSSALRTAATVRGMVLWEVVLLLMGVLAARTAYRAVGWLAAAVGGGRRRVVARVVAFPSGPKLRANGGRTKEVRQALLLELQSIKDAMAHARHQAEGRAEAGIIHMDSMDDLTMKMRMTMADACSFEEIGSERDKENDGPNSTTARQRLRMGMNLRRAMWRGEL